MALAASLGTSSLAVVRWVYGRWLPSLEQLLHNKLLLAYLALSAVVGATVTWMFDQPENPRLNTLITVMLKVGGSWGGGRLNALITVMLKVGEPGGGGRLNTLITVMLKVGAAGIVKMCVGEETGKLQVCVWRGRHSQGVCGGGDG